MIKLLPLFFTFTLLQGATFTYLLPDEYPLFESELLDHLKGDTHSISIITPMMDYPALKKKLIHTLSKGSNLTLITSNPTKDAVQIIAYSGAELYHYRSRMLQGSSITIDEAFGCQIATVLDEKVLTNAAQIVICTNEPEVVKKITYDSKKLKKRSLNYLK